MKQYLVEFKVGSGWIQTRTFDGHSESAAVATEKTLHDAGIKARIVVVTIDRSFLGGQLKGEGEI